MSNIRNLENAGAWQVNKVLGECDAFQITKKLIHQTRKTVAMNTIIVKSIRSILSCSLIITFLYVLYGINVFFYFLGLHDLEYIKQNSSLWLHSITSLILFFVLSLLVALIHFYKPNIAPTTDKYFKNEISNKLMKSMGAMLVGILGIGFAFFIFASGMTEGSPGYTNLLGGASAILGGIVGIVGGILLLGSVPFLLISFMGKLIGEIGNILASILLGIDFMLLIPIYFWIKKGFGSAVLIWIIVGIVILLIDWLFKEGI